MPYVVSDDGGVVGFIFGYPLRSGHPTERANKILRVVRLPRNGQPLTIIARPTGTSGPVVSTMQPANSGPGEIYPTIVDVPDAGCWDLNLEWDSHTATLRLHFNLA